MDYYVTINAKGFIFSSDLQKSEKLHTKVDIKKREVVGRKLVVVFKVISVQPHKSVFQSVNADTNNKKPFQGNRNLAHCLELSKDILTHHFTPF